MGTLAGVTCSACLLPPRSGRIFGIGGLRTSLWFLLVGLGLSVSHDIEDVFGSTVVGRGRTRVVIFDIRGRHIVIRRPSRTARSCRLHDALHEGANRDTAPKWGLRQLGTMTKWRRFMQTPEINRSIPTLDAESRQTGAQQQARVALEGPLAWILTRARRWMAVVIHAGCFCMTAAQEWKRP